MLLILHHLLCREAGMLSCGAEFWIIFPEEIPELGPEAPVSTGSGDGIVGNWVDVFIAVEIGFTISTNSSPL